MSTWQGQLVTVYADLISRMWSGKVTVVAPTEFKAAIGRFAPQFAGYNQQDSQELMNFLLDGLHEDTNRVINKKNTDVPEVLELCCWRAVFGEGSRTRSTLTLSLSC